MEDLIKLDQFPIDKPGSLGYSELLRRCRLDVDELGMFTLEGFLHNEGLQRCLQEIEQHESLLFTHSREHNIFFESGNLGLEATHPALKKMHTTNHTISGDLLLNSQLNKIYEWQPLIHFIADVLTLPALFPMADPLARLNVKIFNDGEGSSWHFDRSEFTTTLLLAVPEHGGNFEISKNLRSDYDPNFEGIGHLLNGNRDLVRSLSMEPGTLNVFLGKHSAHRVTSVQGDKRRIVAVLSYCEKDNVIFSDEDRRSFYGRSEPMV